MNAVLSLIKQYLIKRLTNLLIFMGVSLFLYLIYKLFFKNSKIVASTLSYLHDLTLPRGFRNNNPFNLVQSSIAWHGKINPSTDSKFEQFDLFVNGVRAGLMDIIHDIKSGKNTVRSLIEEFAPKTENDTEKYIQVVSSSLRKKDTDIITPDKQTLWFIASAIVKHENGKDLDISVFNQAWSLI